MLLVWFLELDQTLKFYILILVILRLLLHKYLRLLRGRVLLLWGPMELSILVKGQVYRTRS